MSKLETRFNNPIDVVLEKLYSPAMPYLHKMSVTPNMLTTVSLVAGLYAAKLIWDGKHQQGAFMFLISYFFDCMDGHMARRYNMESHFGDWYDHITDVITLGLGLVALVKRNKYSKRTLVVLTLVFVFLLLNTLKWFGCQEKVYDNEIGKSIAMFKKLCKDPDAELISRKYLGTGTLMMFVFLIIYFSK